MKRSGTEATRTQIQPSRPKGEQLKLQIAKKKQNIWSTV